MDAQMESTRDEYLKKAHDRLDGWESRVEQLAQDVHEARQLKSAMRQPVEQQVAPKLAAFRSRVQELATADAGNWEFMRERVEKAEAALAGAVDEVTDAFDVA